MDEALDAPTGILLVATRDDELAPAEDRTGTADEEVPATDGGDAAFRAEDESWLLDETD